MRPDIGGLQTIRNLLEKATLLVNHNIKFDLHWLRLVGIEPTLPVWDTMLAEFVIERQLNPLPSLDYCGEKYNLGKKLSFIEENYWNKGIDTDAIPFNELAEYSIQDVVLTEKVFLEQQKHLTGRQLTLFHLMCQDLRILQDMEWNGLRFDKELCQQKSQELDNKIASILNVLSNYYPDVPINFNSGDDLSAFLFGGTVTEIIKVPDGYYKSGLKAGLPKFRNQEKTHILPRLYKPLKELKKQGVFATNVDTLKKLSGDIPKMLLELSKLDKLNSTYARGLIKLHGEMNWPEGYIHGQFNQAIAGTGRLSSNKPNLQNFSPEIESVFITRFK